MNIGDKVLAKWVDGNYYTGIIVSIDLLTRPDKPYLVHFDRGTVPNGARNRVSALEIRLIN